MKLRSALLALVALAISFGAYADNHESPPDLSDVWVLAPKKGEFDAFAAAMAEYMAWRAEVGDSRQWMAFVPVIGHEMNRVMYRSCCHEWGDMDTYLEEAEEKGYGPKFNEMVGPHLDHAHHYMDVTDWDNSYWTDDPKGPYFGATTWYMDESYTPQAYAARVKMSELAKDGWASDDNQWLWVTNVGGTPQLAIVSSFSNYADMAPPEVSFFEFLAEKLGSEDEVHKLFGDFSAGKKKSDYTVWRYAAELSSPADDE